MLDACSDLTDLVRARIANAAVDDPQVRRVLQAELKGFSQPTDKHSVWWNGHAWSHADAWSSEAR